MLYKTLKLCALVGAANAYTLPSVPRVRRAAPFVARRASGHRSIRAPYNSIDI